MCRMVTNSLLSLIFGAVCVNGQRKMPEPQKPIPERRVHVVETHGLPIEEFTLMVDGAYVKENAAGFYTIPDGRSRYIVRAHGFEPFEGDISVSQDTPEIIICLRVGSLWDRSPNRFSLVLNGSDDAIRRCTRGLLLPLDCAFCRSPMAFRMYGGRFNFADLVPGTYVLVLNDGDRRCLVKEIDFPELGGVVKVTLEAR